MAPNGTLLPPRTTPMADTTGCSSCGRQGPCHRVSRHGRGHATHGGGSTARKAGPLRSTTSHILILNPKSTMRCFESTPAVTHPGPWPRYPRSTSTVSLKQFKWQCLLLPPLYREGLATQMCFPLPPNIPAKDSGSAPFLCVPVTNGSPPLMPHDQLWQQPRTCWL